MINTMVGVLLVTFMSLGVVFVSYVLYTLIRDDRRREKERKNKDWIQVVAFATALFYRKEIVWK